MPASVVRVLLCPSVAIKGFRRGSDCVCVWVCASRMEATADVICDVLLGNVAGVSAPASGAAAVPSVASPTPLPVRFSFDTTATNNCGGGSFYSCSTTVTSPACLQLFAVATNIAYVCSNDPQYLTVTSATDALEFSYTVRCVKLVSARAG
jgi:hypothetical protein